MVEIKPLEFVDDIADPNNGLYLLSFDADKCKVLKIGTSRHTDHSININLTLLMSLGI